MDVPGRGEWGLAAHAHRGLDLTLADHEADPGHLPGGSARTLGPDAPADRDRSGLEHRAPLQAVKQAVRTWPTNRT